MAPKKRKGRSGPIPDVHEKPSLYTTEAHFRLLREYGRNPLAQKISKREQEKLWELLCTTARVQFIPRELVEEEWKRYISGKSEHSGLAINGDIDPEFTTIAFSHHQRLTAGHTTRTTKLLDKILEIFARNHSTKDAFLDAVEFKCKRIADKVF